MKSNSDQIIIGRNSIREVLLHSPQRIEELMISENIRDGLKELIGLAINKGINIKYVKAREIDNLSEGRQNQGILAFLSERKNLTLDEIITNSKQKSRSIILVLDSITDPQNLGSILRAAECFGVEAVVFSKNRGSPVTATVTKTSVGASEIVPLCEVSNLANAVEKLKRDGDFWVVAATINEKAISLHSFDFPQKTVLIMGSEGDGIQPLLIKRSDFQVYIQMFGKIDSLNVGQATAVMLYQYSKSGV